VKLSLVLAASAVNAVDQRMPAAGLDGDQRGQRDALTAVGSYRQQRGLALSS
jgi:hypothetical protein